MAAPHTTTHTHTRAQHKPTRARRAVLLVSTRLNAGTPPPNEHVPGGRPSATAAHRAPAQVHPTARASQRTSPPAADIYCRPPKQLRTAARVPGFALLTGAERAFTPSPLPSLDRVARTAARTRPRGRSVRAGRAQNAPAPHPDHSQLNRTLGTATAPHFLLNAQAAAAAPAAAHEGAQAAGAVHCI